MFRPHGLKDKSEETVTSLTRVNDWIKSAHPTVILRSRALARRLEGSPRALVAHPSRLAEDGEHLRMTVVFCGAP
jgi:hypothetical protein